MLVERKGKVADTKHCRENLKEFKWFMSLAKVSSMEDRHKKIAVTVLRDTAATQSLILESALPADCPFMDWEIVVLRGFPDSWTTCPMVELFLDSPLVKGQAKVAVVKELPLEGVTFVLANDLARGNVGSDPLLGDGTCGEGNLLEDGIKGSIVQQVNVLTRTQVGKDELTEEYEEMGSLLAKQEVNE